MSEDRISARTGPPDIPLTTIAHNTVEFGMSRTRDPSDPPGGGDENPEAPERFETTHEGETEGTQLPIHTVARRLRGIHIFVSRYHPQVKHCGHPPTFCSGLTGK